MVLDDIVLSLDEDEMMLRMRRVLPNIEQYLSGIRRKQGQETEEAHSLILFKMLVKDGKAPGMLSECEKLLDDSLASGKLLGEGDANPFAKL